MTFETEVKCKYCGKAFLDGLKGTRKEPFVCNECEEKHKDIFLVASDMLNSAKALHEYLNSVGIDASIAQELLNDAVQETSDRIESIRNHLNSNL